MKLLNLNNTPILEQLHLEEALLRADNRNWCIINTDAAPAIVMGISGKPDQLLNLEKVKRDHIPVIKRFSGGGTVYIDPQTVFVTFICNVSDVLVPAQPKPILEWSEKLYASLFTGFQLRENDYVFGTQKFGGNAQYIQKGRWLHHTSFLWDYDPENMDYLLLPQRRPEYRQSRSHKDFLCTLQTRFSEKAELTAALRRHITKHFNATPVAIESVYAILERPHRQTSTALFF